LRTTKDINKENHKSTKTERSTKQIIKRTTKDINKEKHKGTKQKEAQKRIINIYFMYQILSEREEFLAKEIVDIAFKIHFQLGPGLLESIYEKCFCYELSKRNIPYLSQQHIDIHYDEMIIEKGLRIDLVIDDLIIVELKAQENIHPVWEAQLLSYLKMTEKRLGFIVNFHVPKIKEGIKRMIN
jgi:GxxExxY protein